MWVEASIGIEADARRILEFVADLRRYRVRLRGLPTPPQWQTVLLESWSRLTSTSEAGQWTNRHSREASRASPSTSGRRR
jgi:hypothetical protein